ncbi:protein PFC0760c-like isoform X2 [Centruroides sculpturatus]|uniref:protein PFC0760c-like isoform X2 n=1 Tax=Centruroides sculpturatus TaxID=218467 RepID=UPI000C6C920B|nr:protein PFC0760c-like isoform X2 [Centruroides sculpturatus]
MKENIDRTVVESDSPISIIKQPNVDSLMLERREMDTSLDSLYDFTNSEDDGFEEDFADQLQDKIRAKLIDANIQFQADETPIESDRVRHVTFRERLVDVVSCTPPVSPDFSEDEDINEKSLEEIQTASQIPSSEHFEDDVYGFDNEFVPLLCENSKLEDISEDNESNLEDNSDDTVVQETVQKANELESNNNIDDYENNNFESDNETESKDSQLNDENVVENVESQLSEENIIENGDPQVKDENEKQAESESKRHELNEEEELQLNDDKDQIDLQCKKGELIDTDDLLLCNNDVETNELQSYEIHNNNDDHQEEKELEMEEVIQCTPNVEERCDFKTEEIENEEIKYDDDDDDENDISESKNDNLKSENSDDYMQCDKHEDLIEEIKENDFEVEDNSTLLHNKPVEEQKVEVLEAPESKISVSDAMLALKKDIKCCPNNAQSKHSKSMEEILNLKRYEPPTNSTSLFKNFKESNSALPKSSPKHSKTKVSSSKSKQAGEQASKKLPNYKGNPRSQYGLSQEELEELRHRNKEKALQKKMKEMEIEQDKLQRKRESEQAYEAWLMRKKAANQTKSTEKNKVSDEKILLVGTKEKQQRGGRSFSNVVGKERGATVRRQNNQSATKRGNLAR